MKGKNISIVSRQDDVAGFYNRASVVVNLSDKERFIETFGLTALEAMSAGLPVIVPTVGGIAEMVEDGVNGYKTDVARMDSIIRQVEDMLSDEQTYCRMAGNALRRSGLYDESNMIGKIEDVLFAKGNPNV